MKMKISALRKCFTVGQPRISFAKITYWVVEVGVVDDAVVEVVNDEELGLRFKRVNTGPEQA